MLHILLPLMTLVLVLVFQKMWHVCKQNWILFYFDKSQGRSGFVPLASNFYINCNWSTHPPFADFDISNKKLGWLSVYHDVSPVLWLVAYSNQEDCVIFVKRKTTLTIKSCVQHWTFVYLLVDNMLFTFMLVALLQDANASPFLFRCLHVPMLQLKKRDFCESTLVINLFETECSQWQSWDLVVMKECGH